MKNKQIKIGAMLSYLSIAVNMVAGFIYTPWMIQQIGKSQYGLFTLAHSLISLFLVDFGLYSAITRYVSKFRAENNQEKANEFLSAVYKLYMLIDCIIFLALFTIYFFIEKIYVNLTPDELVQFKVVYIIAGASSLVTFPFVTFNGILSAYEKFIQLRLADLLYRLLSTGLIVVALLLNQGLYALVAINAIVSVLVVIYKYIVISKTTPVKVTFKTSSKHYYKEIFSFSIWTTLNSLAHRLIFNITPSILGVFVNSAEIAVFGIVSTMEGYVYTITGAINGMFMPKISRIYAENDDNNAVLPLMLKVGRLQYMMNGLIIVGFAVVGKNFIQLWMGKNYLAAYYGILLVIIPGLFYNSLQIANTAMVVKKKVNIQAGISIVSGIINVICSCFFSKMFGMIGACVSIFISYMARAILNNIAIYKVMKIDVLTFCKKCYLQLAPGLLLTLLIGFGLNMLIDKVGWIWLIIKGLAIVVVYLLSIYFVSLNGEEKSLVKGLLVKMHNRLLHKKPTT